MRDRSIDVSRGILVLMMVYGHVLQFFGDAQLFPVVAVLTDAINVTVFPTFVFCFGWAAAAVYLGKPYRRALPGMAKTVLRAYAAFVLSGVGFRVLRENVPFAVGTVRRVMQLADIPGWSEFLAAFALYGLLLMLLFPLLQRLAQRPVCMLLIGLLCVVCCELVPYDMVAPVQLALLIGGTGFSYFPVLQYMPYFLAGMAYARMGEGNRRKLVAAAALCALPALVKCVITGGLPSRFPPDWAWVCLSALPAAGVMLLGKGQQLLQMRFGFPVIRAAGDVLAHFGSRSLYYLLCSNLVLFTMAGKHIVPAMARKSVVPWSTPIQSPMGALYWTAVLLAALWFVSRLAGRGNPKRA